LTKRVQVWLDTLEIRRSAFVFAAKGVLLFEDVTSPSVKISSAAAGGTVFSH
jgi:hypothetical protein